MNVLVYLAPLPLALGGFDLVAFLLAFKHGQFDDLDGAAWRAISDDDLPGISGRRKAPAHCRFVDTFRRHGDSRASAPLAL